MSQFSVLFVFVGCVFPGDPSINTNLADSAGARKNCENYCGDCHGEKMDAFVDRNLETGEYGCMM